MQLLFAKINHVIYFSLSQLLLAKINEHRTASRKAPLQPLSLITFVSEWKSCDEPAGFMQRKRKFSAVCKVPYSHDGKMYVKLNKNDLSSSEIHKKNKTGKVHFAGFADCLQQLINDGSCCLHQTRILYHLAAKNCTDKTSILFPSHWMGSDRGDSFPFDFLNQMELHLVLMIIIESLIIQFERKWNASFLGVIRSGVQLSERLT